ncbi:MAG TPA: hypothetical protein VFK65_07485, partial [Candidatus Binatia bacterium]|nr:hypothetical protein [Candidatus Binatia bacterium]
IRLTTVKLARTGIGNPAAGSGSGIVIELLHGITPRPTLAPAASMRNDYGLCYGAAYGERVGRSRRVVKISTL